MAQPIKGNPGPNPINGTAGKDKLQGKGGDDVITGGKGDDDIDGGQGFDVAKYTGSFWDYLITRKGTGNDKVTVQDLIANRDGLDSLKQVEALQFNDLTIRLDQNNAAITRSDTATTSEDSPVVINVLANDTDFEGNALTITEIDGQAISVGGSVVLASGATVTLNADMTLTYDPGSSSFQSLNGGENGIENFTYTVTDSEGASSAPTSVAVTVQGAWEAVTTAVNAEIDESGQKPATEDILNGAGIPATDFGIVRAEDAGIELGLQVIYRQGPAVQSTDDYADGVLHFTVNDGPQSTANGSFANNAGRAAWSFDFSIITGLNGETTNLDDFTFKLLYDVDPGAGTDYRTLTLESGGSGTSGHQWRDSGSGLVFIADDSGNANVTQNSENYAFAFFQSFLTSAYGPGNGFAGPAQFDIILEAYDLSNTLIAQNHIAVDVVI